MNSVFLFSMDEKPLEKLPAGSLYSHRYIRETRLHRALLSKCYDTLGEIFTALESTKFPEKARHYVNMLNDKTHESALDLATKIPDINLVRKIIKLGADTEYNSFSVKKTPLHYLASLTEPTDYQVRLAEFFLSSKVDMVPHVYELDDIGLSTAIMCAALSRNSKVLDFLLKNKKHVDFENEDSELQSSLGLALRKGDFEIFDQLMSANLRLNSIYYGGDCDEYTPLHVAIDINNKDIFKKVIDSIKNDDQYSLQEWPCVYGSLLGDIVYMEKIDDTFYLESLISEGLEPDFDALEDLAKRQGKVNFENFFREKKEEKKTVLLPNKKRKQEYSYDGHVLKKHRTE